MDIKIKGLLWDAADAARHAIEFVEGKTQEEFIDDSLTVAAVERMLEKLGEALNQLRRLDPIVASKIPGLTDAIGMRNIIAHEYGSVNYVILWDTVVNDLPGLVTEVQSLLD